MEEIILIPPPNPPSVEYFNGNITQKGWLAIEQYFKHLDKYKVDCLNDFFKHINEESK